jgi:hypothetical protein
MMKIEKMSNEEEIHYFEFANSANTHNELIGFLYNMLGFSADESNRIDVPFSELNEGYICVKKADMKIHFFICNNKTHMVIDSKKSQEKITQLMKQHFVFPK